MNPLGNPFLTAAALISFLCMWAAVYLPFGRAIFATVTLSPRDAAIVLALSFAATVIAPPSLRFGGKRSSFEPKSKRIKVRREPQI